MAIGVWSSLSTKPVQDGSDTIQLNSIHDPEPESSVTVPKVDVSIGSRRELLPLDPEWTGEKRISWIQGITGFGPASVAKSRELTSGHCVHFAAAGRHPTLVSQTPCTEVALMNAAVNCRQLRVASRWAGLAFALSTACTFNDSNQDIEQNVDKLEQRLLVGGQAGARSVTTAPKAAAPQPFASTASLQAGFGVTPPDSGVSLGDGHSLDKPQSLHCPDKMLEVVGSYCTDLMHRCIKGGRTHTEEETEEPEPYYCDAYLPGFAKCLEKEDRSISVSMNSNTRTRRAPSPW